MIWFVGAGPGAPDLITLRGAEVLKKCDLCVYAGSLVNPELLALCRPGCRIVDSAPLTLEETHALLRSAAIAGEEAVRLHTGDPSLYGAVAEQMALLDAEGLAYRTVPGVSSFQAAAAALNAEFTLPGVSQTVILTRAEGRTAVPPGEALVDLARHGASMCLFLSAGLAEKVRQGLLEGGYAPDCPVALVYRASWPDEQVVCCTVDSLPQALKGAGIKRQVQILVGDFLTRRGERSKLYDGSFSHGWRK